MMRNYTVIKQNGRPLSSSPVSCGGEKPFLWTALEAVRVRDEGGYAAVYYRGRPARGLYFWAGLERRLKRAGLWLGETRVYRHD